MIDQELLSAVPVLDALNDRARRELAARSVFIRRDSGQRFWEAGDAPRGILIILEGRIRLVRSAASGRRQVVHREGPGAVLGEVPLFDGGGYPATAEAEVPVEAILVTVEAFEAAVAADPAFGRALLANLAGRVRHLVDRLEALSTLDVRSRLARHLLDRANLRGDAAFDLGTTQAALAEDIGTVREVVVRNLAWLRKRGILTTVGRGTYQLDNRAALEAIAEV